jgi:hypothetical protein
MVRKGLLICGMLSSLLYVGMNVFVAMQWETYSSVSQTVSELSAIGAPTRPLWVLLGIAYMSLVSAFGWGVWRSAGRNRPLRLVGGLMVAYGVIGLFWPPMHLRGDEPTLTDTMHIVFTMVTVVLMLLAIGFGAAAFGNRFRLYSIATIAITVTFGTLAGLNGPRIAANLPTPWVGVWERISIAAFLLWVVVLAIVIFRLEGSIVARARQEIVMTKRGPLPASPDFKTVGREAISPSTRVVGLWSAVLATIFSLTYAVGQIAEWVGLMGSGGGAENASTPLGLVVLLTPSLFLGSAFLVLIVSIHELACPDRKIWSHTAVAFATAYTVLISINYFVQLTWVAPRLAAGQTQGIEPFLFTPFDSFLYAGDILGYSFMSVATLFAAMVFTGGGLNRIVRRFLIANGLLLPFIALQMYSHPLIWIAALWAVTFPGATWSLAILFRRARTVTAAPELREAA